MAETMATTFTGAAHRLTQIPVRDGALAEDFEVPDGATGIVIFADGSGSARVSPRSQYVARALREAGLATLLPELLTEAEERNDHLAALLRSDIGFLTSRLIETIRWVATMPATRGLPIGLFGVSTAAAAALAAAAAVPGLVSSVVSRGDRPDLAGGHLPLVSAPTMLIVGGYDAKALAHNSDAFARLRCEKRLCFVPGSTHLGMGDALDAVALGAAEWLARLLPAAPSPDRTSGSR
jgi:dienelactone hydrolase